MRRGSTPTLKFELPLEIDNNVTKLRVTFEQNDKIIFEKTERDIFINEQFFNLQLTQEETLMFDSSVPIRMQVKIRTTDGNVVPSDVVLIECKDVLSEEIL